jgi:hypothetical protein
MRCDTVSTAKGLRNFRMILLFPFQSLSKFRKFDPEDGDSKMSWNVGNYLPTDVGRHISYDLSLHQKYCENLKYWNFKGPFN